MGPSFVRLGRGPADSARLHASLCNSGRSGREGGAEDFVRRTAPRVGEMRVCVQLERRNRFETSQKIPIAASRDLAVPSIFNVALDILADTFCRLAERRGWGYHLDGGFRVAVILFANSFWLLAPSRKQLEEMTEAWVTILAEAGWVVPLDETIWCSTQSDDVPGQVNVQGTTLRRVARNEGFKVFGITVTFDNSAEVELLSSVSKALRAFYTYKHEYPKCCGQM